MKQAALVFIFIVSATIAFAQVKNEEVLINRIVLCFAHKDDSAYMKLFPKYEDLQKLAMNFKDTDVVSARRIQNIRSHPKLLQQFDPAFNEDIVKDFDFIYQKGVDSGLHWNDALIARYNLEKEMLTREMVGFEKVVRYRLQGYIFLQDLLTRKVFCIALKDIHGFNDQWYGGRIINIIPAESIEEYYEKLAFEKKALKHLLIAQMYAAADTAGQADDSVAIAAKKKQDEMKKAAVAAADDEDEDKNEITTQVVDRKLYKGTYDKEIGLELYVRSLKGKCPQPVCAWQALYKFSDKDEWVKLTVTKGDGGKLIFTEEDAGVLELKFSGGKAMGEWSSFKDKTSYDVELTEKKEVKNRKLFQLDDILEGSGDGDY
jgi:hypothetical protein